MTDYDEAFNAWWDQVLSNKERETNTITVTERAFRYGMEVAPPKAGVLHEIDIAFYRLSVMQRDAAWREAEALREFIVKYMVGKRC